MGSPEFTATESKMGANRTKIVFSNLCWVCYSVWQIQQFGSNYINKKAVKYNMQTDNFMTLYTVTPNILLFSGSKCHRLTVGNEFNKKKILNENKK